MKRQFIHCNVYLMGRIRNVFRLLLCLQHCSCTSYRLCIVLGFASLTLFASFLHIFSISATLYCLNYKTKNAVENLCHHYKTGQVAGNLCEDLCSDGQHLTIISCFMPHVAKDIVFAAQWRRQAVIIKAGHENLAAFDPFPRSISTDANDHLISSKEFLNILRDVVAVNFDINFIEHHLLLPRTFVQTFLSGYDRGFPKNASKALLQSIWFLVQQKEFLTFKLFESSGMFPIVYGSCGQFYAVEQLEPLSSYIYANWELRAEIVSGILNLLEKVEYGFPYALRICDMKLNHFGVDSSRNFKLLDGDDLYFQDVLNKIVTFGPCSSHHDCSFFDCKSKCDLNKHTCDTGLINTNLQAACKKMFLHSHAFSPGLLHSPPQNVSVLLDKVLETCIASTSTNLLFFKLKNEIMNLLHISV